MSAAQVIRFAFLLQGYPPAEFCKSIQVFPEFKQPSPFPLLFFFFSPLLFFNVEMTDEITTGLALAFGAAILIHILLLVIDFLYKKATYKSRG